MKILRVKIKKHRTPLQCRYTYPECWDAQKINVVVYEEHLDHLGKIEEDCLCVTDNEMAAKLLNEPGVREVTVEEADAFGRQWRPSRRRVTNEDKVISVVKKILSNPSIVTVLKQHLTKEEIDSLDETKEEPGIVRTKQFNISDFLS